MTLDRVLAPRSVAVVGASANPAKRGHQILRALGRTDYGGAVYAVNPAGGRVLGHEALPSVDDLPEAVDLAVLCTPAAAAPSLVNACGDRGVGGALVLAVGFGESGAEGRRLEAKLQAAGKASGVRIVGPNTSGLLNLHIGLNLIGARGVPRGGIALLVQSGNIALALMNEIAASTANGISICCGLGNQIDVSFDEALAYLAEHEPTRVVIAHVEGLRDGRAFLQAASALAERKPVVVVKSGRTEGGAGTALSHTGAVAGPYDRLRAGMRQAGIVEVARTDELVPVATALATQPAPRGTEGGGRSVAVLSEGGGTGVAVLSDGGGQNVLAVDALTAMGVSMAVLSSSTQASLRRVLGPAAAVRNPVDVAGAADTDPAAFSRAMDLLATDPAVGVVLVVGLFGGYGIRFSDELTASETEAARAIAATARAAHRGLVVHSMYASQASAPLQVLREAQVPVIESLEAACRAAAELHLRGSRRSRRWPPRRLAARRSAARRSPPDQKARPERQRLLGPDQPDLGRHPALVAARAEGRIALTEVEARDLLADAGVAVHPASVVRSPSEAALVAESAGQPVAVKLLSKHIVHKSDAGGVVLDVAGPAEARDAFDRIARSAAAYARARDLPAESSAALISPMLPTPLAELLVGACRDPQLGPVLTVGAGGVWAESLRDVAHRVLPVAEGEAAEMIGELQTGAVLAGGRGRPAACMDAIARAVEAVSRCIATCRDISEVEINPLFVYRDRAVAVDARVVTVARRAGAADRPA